MRNFDETPGASVDADSFEQEETIWLRPSDAVGLDLVVLSASRGLTQYGPKLFAHVIQEDDPEATEYTVSFSERSAAYAQLSAILEAREEGAFPFRAAIAPVGKTYKLVAATPHETPRGKAPMRGPATPARTVTTKSTDIPF